MTKRITSVILAITLIVSLSVPALAAATQKITVTAEKTAIREKASASAKSLATAKKSQSFTATGSTKSFWKIQFKISGKSYTGYIAKKDAKAIATTTNTEPKTSSWAKAYKDYLSRYKIEKVNLLDGGTQYSWAYLEKGSEYKLICYDVEFRTLKEYDYPIMVLHVSAEMAYSSNYLACIIKNGKAVAIEYDDPEYSTFLPVGEIDLTPKGKQIVEFHLSGADPKAMQRVFDWLDKQK